MLGYPCRMDGYGQSILQSIRNAPYLRTKGKISPLQDSPGEGSKSMPDFEFSAVPCRPARGGPCFGFTWLVGQDVQQLQL